MGYGPLSTQTQVARWQDMLAAINHFDIVHRQTKTRRALPYVARVSNTLI